MMDRSFNTYKEHNMQGTKTLFSQVSVVLSTQSLIELTPALVVGIKGGIDNLLLAEATKKLETGRFDRFPGVSQRL